MKRGLFLAAVVLAIMAAPVSAAGISGQYVEARTCDVWAAPCFANAEMNLSGKHALMGWKVDQGSIAGVALDGLSIVAAVSASDTLGLDQTGTARAVLIVDAKASDAQRAALIRLAKEQGGQLLRNVVAVQSAPIELTTGGCKEGGCASLSAGTARIETRCINTQHDKTCGNERAFYPPLAKDVTARTAVANHSFSGQAFRETWKESERRGAYVGSFSIP
jgi:hypothetical protein